MCLGILLAGFVIFLLRREIPKDLQLKNGLLGGILWGLANLFGIYLIVFFGIAKSGPLTQTCVIVATLWGLFYFKEFEEKRRIFRIISSVIIILTGALLVGLA
jgi:glucose uptake protein